jgi:hypothetical protein
MQSSPFLSVPSSPLFAEGRPSQGRPRPAFCGEANAGNRGPTPSLTYPLRSRFPSATLLGADPRAMAAVSLVVLADQERAGTRSMLGAGTAATAVAAVIQSKRPRRVHEGQARLPL